VSLLSSTLKEAIAIVKNGFLEISVATVRAQAVLKRKNLSRAIEQAEKPFWWQHRYRTGRDYTKRGSWNDQYYETFCSFGPGEGEPGVFARRTNRSYAESRRVYQCTMGDNVMIMSDRP